MRLSPSSKKAAYDFAKALVNQMKQTKPDFNEKVDSIDEGLMDEAMDTFLYAVQSIYLK